MPVVHETAVNDVDYYRLVNVFTWQLFLLIFATLVPIVGGIFAYRYIARLIRDEGGSRSANDHFPIEIQHSICRAMTFMSRRRSVFQCHDVFERRAEAKWRCISCSCRLA